MRVRNEGPDRLVPLPEGDTELVKHLGFIDTTPEHAYSLAEQEGWTLESVIKAKRTRARNDAEETPDKVEED